MADNTKIGPIFRGANGGLSDDLFTGIQNAFYYSNDMEIREDAKSIFPKQPPAYAATVGPNQGTNVGTGATGQHSVRCCIFTGQDGGWVVSCEKDIFKVNESLGLYTVIKLCTMSDEICDMEVFNGYVYVATKNYVYYMKNNGTYWEDMARATDASALYYGRMAQSLSANNNHPLYASDVCLCVGDTNKMWKVTKEVPNLLQNGFTIESDFYIRFINELGGFVRVTAVSSTYGSQILLWDKVSDTVDEIIPLEGYQALGSAIYHGYHYLISDQGLGLINGYQYYILKKMKSDLQTYIRNNMCVYDDKLYIVGTKGIYIYGAKNKNYSDVLSLWHQVEDGFTLGAIASKGEDIIITRNYKYVAGGTDVPVRAGINSYGTASTTRATTGEVQTMCYYGTSMSEIKQSMYLRVGYHIPTAEDYDGTKQSGNIHIYYRTEADAVNDDMDSWQRHEVTKPAGLYADWDMRSPFATTLKLNCRFQWIQFKFVVTNCVYNPEGIVETKDTNLYSADLYYNVMLD